MSYTSSSSYSHTNSRSSASLEKPQSSWFGILQGPRDVVLPRIVLLGTVFILTLFGLVMVFSSSNVIAMDQGTTPESYLVRQIEALAVALVVGVILSKISYSAWLGNALWIALGISFVLLFATALFGTAGLGAKRWLVIGPLNFQPSEFSKVVVVLVGARILYDWRMERATTLQLFIDLIVGIVIPLFFILSSQSDLGTTAICMVGLLSVMIVGDVPWKYIGILLLVFGIIAFIAIFFTGYRMDRLTGFSGGDSDASYQSQMAMQAFAHGGFFGVGIGNSAMKYGTLPMAHTDFIFAIVGEECGFIGAFAIILLFCVLCVSGMKVASHAPDSFGSMIAAGCTVMLVAQAFLNMACVLGIIPVTGKPLPFMSSGGSALIGSYLVVGVILSVSLNSGDNAHIYQKRRNKIRVITDESHKSTRLSSTSHPYTPTFRSTKKSLSNSAQQRERQGSSYKRPKRRTTSSRRRR